MVQDVVCFDILLYNTKTIIYIYFVRNKKPAKTIRKLKKNHTVHHSIPFPPCSSPDFVCVIVFLAGFLVSPPQKYKFNP